MVDSTAAGLEVRGSPAQFSAVLALGTNIGDRIANIEEAIAKLGADGSITVIARSAIYRTAPWGVIDQDWFANACVGVQCALTPHELLKRCQAVENGMGRVRTRHWGPRIIDVDILLMGDRRIREPDLVIPHPLMAERAFVLVPLRDIAPELTIGGKSIDIILGGLEARDVVPFE